MPNVYTNIVPKILAQGLITLRETCLMPQLVNGDYSSDAAKYGTTIDVPIPAPQSVGDITPSNTPPAPATVNITTVQIPLNKWKKTEFFLTDKEQQEIDRRQSFFPMQVAESARALANKVNADILQEYKGIYGFVGTPGTTPFATDTTAATNARKVLAAQLCPKPTRRAILNADAEANALSLAAFQFVNQSGTDITMKEGEIGRKFGFDWYMEDATPTHSSTVLTAGAATVNGVNAIGAGSTDNGRNGTVSIAKATNSSPLVKGDIITISGDNQTYVVTADTTLAVGNTTVPIAPALKKATAGGETVSLKATHVVNMAFHRNAFAFANRQVEGSVFTGGNIIQQMTDPKTGISLALEVSRQHHQTVWEFSILYGCKLVREELAVRIAG